MGLDINSFLAKMLVSKNPKENQNQENVQESYEDYERDDSLYTYMVLDGQNHKIMNSDGEFENGVDENSDGQLDYNEFSNIFEDVKNSSEYVKNANINDDLNLMFQMLDKDGDGKISEDELKAMLEFDKRASKQGAIDLYTIGHYFFGLNNDKVEEALEREENGGMTREKATLVDGARTFYNSFADEDKAAAVYELVKMGFSSSEIAEITGQKEAEELLKEALGNNVKNQIFKMIQAGSTYDQIIKNLKTLNVDVNDEKIQNIIRTYVDSTKLLLTDFEEQHNNDVAAKKEAYLNAVSQNPVNEQQQKEILTILYNCSSYYTQNDILEITGIKDLEANLPDSIDDNIKQKIYEAIEKGEDPMEVIENLSLGDKADIVKKYINTISNLHKMWQEVAKEADQNLTVNNALALYKNTKNDEQRETIINNLYQYLDNNILSDENTNPNITQEVLTSIQGNVNSGNYSNAEEVWNALPSDITNGIELSEIQDYIEKLLEIKKQTKQIDNERTIAEKKSEYEYASSADKKQEILQEVCDYLAKDLPDSIDSETLSKIQNAIITGDYDNAEELLANLSSEITIADSDLDTVINYIDEILDFKAEGDINAKSRNINSQKEKYNTSSQNGKHTILKSLYQQNYPDNFNEILEITGIKEKEGKILEGQSDETIAEIRQAIESGKSFDEVKQMIQNALGTDSLTASQTIKAKNYYNAMKNLYNEIETIKYEIQRDNKLSEYERANTDAERDNIKAELYQLIENNLSDNVTEDAKEFIKNKVNSGNYDNISSLWNDISSEETLNGIKYEDVEAYMSDLLKIKSKTDAIDKDIRIQDLKTKYSQAKTETEQKAILRLVSNEFKTIIPQNIAQDTVDSEHSQDSEFLQKLNEAIYSGKYNNADELWQAFPDKFGQTFGNNGHDLTLVNKYINAMLNFMREAGTIDEE